MAIPTAIRKRRALRGGDEVGDGVGLAAAGDAEQGLMRQTVLQTGRQGADGVRLIAGGLEAGAKLKGLARLHGRLVGA